MQFNDNLSWIKGNHTFKFGFEFERQNFDQVGNQFARGQFIFQPNATQSPTHTDGNGFADFMLGDIYESVESVSVAQANYQRNIAAAFVDDTWKVTPRLTVSLGLRYELTPPFVDQLTDPPLFSIYLPHIDFFSNAPQSDWPYFIRQGNCQDAYAGPPTINIHWTSTPARCNNGLENNAFNQTQYKNFAPRVSIAYSPDSKTMIRAAYGIFYVQDNGNSMYFDMARNVAARVTNYSNPGTPSLFWNNALPSGNAVAQVGPPYAFVAAYDHKTAYNEQYLLNVQRQLSSDWAIEGGYLGSQSHHLYGFQNANMGIPGTAGSAVSRFPFADFGVIQLVANYNSLAFKVTKRFSHGLNLIASYTYSKSLDDTSGIRVQNYDTLFPQNSDCIRQCEYGLSSFNVPHRFVTSVLYDLPVGQGNRLNITRKFANAVIGGWEMGGIMTIQSGVPQTLSIGGVDNSSTTQGNDRPSANGQSAYASNKTPSDWLNRAAYVEAAPGAFGNVGRNTALIPGTFDIDAEIHKSFVMPYNEHHQFQLRFEAFNALNHPNWGAPNGNVLAGAPFPGAPSTAAHQGFGVISNTSVAMRQLQLGLKYTF